MSTPFKPLEIPPGVVSMATKKMRSSNWAEVNLVRWREGKLFPVGPQSKYAYNFASRCKAVHPWYSLDGVNHIAYLCETNLYVDIGGQLFDITPADGMISPTAPTTGGYGDGLYSADTYGTPRTADQAASLTRIPDAWSLDNFGAILLAMTSPDGRLLHWDPASGTSTPATVVTPKAGSTVPHGRCFVVTPERFVLIFASTQDGTPGDGGSFRRFAWCNQEDFTDWSYADVTSQAGFLDVEPSSPIITAISTRTGTIFWTGKKAYKSAFIGLPYVYNFEELADGTTPWSCESVVTTSSMALWMSEQGVFSFDGTSILPVQCPVRPWVDGDIDLVNVRFQACAVHVGDFSEFWWFYPQLDQPFNTRAIIYNYKEGWWSQGRMSRSAGISSSFTAFTIMCDGLDAYQHELGLTYGAADPPFAQTFDLNVGSGARLSTVKQLLPDVEGDVANLRFQLAGRRARADGVGDAEALGPLQSVNANGYVDFRQTARDFRLIVKVASTIIKPFTIGQHLIDVVPRGDR